ncbi:MAG: 2-oxoglutarate dehydrogenase, E2 component, dihydrolipoamide succinyltransferase [Acidimicrobiia bacterium]|nr:MAG: 2-oxoglutarate dehydrogenase, E2 component, dihydrolipoamide succinyltransferase [Acidimicrobiia bacterium]
MAVTITMPQLGETVTEGTILAWVKQIGEYVAEDDILVEISTDKVDTEVPSPAAGVLTEILVPAGTTVDVGTALAVLSDEGEGSPEASSESDSDEPTADSVQPTADSVQPTADSVQPTADSVQKMSEAMTERRGVLSPVVRKLAAENNVDLAMVPGTGDGGRITRKDVEAFVEARGDAPASTPAPAAPVLAPVAGTPPPAPRPAAVTQPGEVQEISRLRSRIATNMIHAKQTAAHVWTSVEVDYERVAAARAEYGPAFRTAEGFSLTYLPFIARATMDALAAYPAVNSSFDMEAGTHTFHRSVNLGIAVDLDQKGLVVVNVRDADSMTLKALARSIRAMATDVRAGKLGPDDLTAYTFSITNPGPFGSFMSAPIIPVPNSAILSTDTVTKRAVVVELPDGSDGLVIHHIGYLGLSWDHRVFDGATAALFLRRIKENLETWDWDQELS